MYEGVFRTPLACHEHSLLVYPRLPSSELQTRWDSLETGLFNGDISEKEYSVALEDIFREAGYLLPLVNGEMVALRSDRTINHSPSGVNYGLSHCQAEINLLQQQLEEMRKELQKMKMEQKNSVT
ncbi:hypothetical protein J437_LFUL007461 [Ladona fulva]|uniref:Uncharacterized protein n=1 Tax=Ladona fulva TaxID=123851 RepID=A0A8K0KCP8_LADFU|nr:hypothetical protein J437_LFUL007461 [Ladona fulva]